MTLQDVSYVPPIASADRMEIAEACQEIERICRELSDPGIDYEDAEALAWCVSEHAHLMIRLARSRRPLNEWEQARQ